jgi:hypothetical protein
MLEAVLVPKGYIEDCCVVANSCEGIQGVHSFLLSGRFSSKCGLNNLWTCGKMGVMRCHIPRYSCSRVDSSHEDSQER